MSRDEKDFVKVGEDVWLLAEWNLNQPFAELLSLLGTIEFDWDPGNAVIDEQTDPGHDAVRLHFDGPTESEKVDVSCNWSFTIFGIPLLTVSLGAAERFDEAKGALVADGAEFLALRIVVDVSSGDPQEVGRPRLG